METILCVDDDRTTTEILVKFLQRSGYSTLTARSGQEALATLENVQPSLIVLDYMMPEMSGLQVLKEIKKNPRLHDVPVVMFTAKTSVNDKIECFQAGAAGYLPKPIEPGEFLAHIRAILARKPLSAEPLPSKSPRGRVIGISSVKGGLGASTLAINLALCLALKTGEEVSAIEPQPGEGSWGIELGLQTYGLDELLMMPPSKINLESIKSKTHEIANNVRLLTTQLSIGVSQETMAAQVDALLASYPFLSPIVILDLGQISTASPQLLRVCDELVLVVEPSQTTIERARQVVCDLSLLGFARGGKKSLSVVPVNRYQFESGLTLSQIEETLGVPTLPLIPPDPSLAYRAQREKKPFMLIQPTSIACMQYMAIAKDLTKFMPMAPHRLATV